MFVFPLFPVRVFFCSPGLLGWGVRVSPRCSPLPAFCVCVRFGAFSGALPAGGDILSPSAAIYVSALKPSAPIARCSPNPCRYKGHQPSAIGARIPQGFAAIMDNQGNTQTNRTLWSDITSQTGSSEEEHPDGPRQAQATRVGEDERANPCNIATALYPSEVNHRNTETKVQKIGTSLDKTDFDRLPAFVEHISERPYRSPDLQL